MFEDIFQEASRGLPEIPLKLLKISRRIYPKDPPVSILFFTLLSSVGILLYLSLVS